MFEQFFILSSWVSIHINWCNLNRYGPYIQGGNRRLQKIWDEVTNSSFVSFFSVCFVREVIGLSCTVWYALEKKQNYEICYQLNENNLNFLSPYCHRILVKNALVLRIEWFNISKTNFRCCYVCIIFRTIKKRIFILCLNACGHYRKSVQYNRQALKVAYSESHYHEKYGTSAIFWVKNNVKRS